MHDTAGRRGVLASSQTTAWAGARGLRFGVSAIGIIPVGGVPGRRAFGYLAVGVGRAFGPHEVFVAWAHGNPAQFNTGPTVSWSWTP